MDRMSVADEQERERESAAPDRACPARSTERRSVWSAARSGLSHVRSMRRPRWWQEALFIGISYFLYTLTRNSVPAHELLAMHRAVDVLNFEHALHIDIEHTVNTTVAGLTWVAVPADYYYATLHFAITIGTLLWLYVRHPWRYRGVRTALYVTNMVALLGFWLFPLAPPRMLPGFVDTVVHFHTWGSWGSGDVAAASNQFAAMPSLHIGWSLWCGVTLWRLAKPMWVRIAGLCYPAVTLLVIVGTANHFLLDAVGGVVALSIGFAIQRLIFGRPAYTPVERKRAYDAVPAGAS